MGDNVCGTNLNSGTTAVFRDVVCFVRSLRHPVVFLQGEGTSQRQLYLRYTHDFYSVDNRAGDNPLRHSAATK